MELSNDIAALSMSMKTEQFMQDYSVSLTKKVMDTQELELQAIEQMMPTIPKGEFIDVYA